MTDNELRGKLLKELYDKRREGFIRIGEDLEGHSNEQEIVQIAQQLNSHGLIEFKMLTRFLGGSARITAHGIDVIEGTQQSPISIAIGGSQTFNISHSSNIQVGNHNSQVINDGLHTLIQIINDSTSNAAEKEEAKSLLKSFLEHPLVSTIVGSTIALLST